ncbi:MAG TPA: hypothetical protein VMZ01_04680 [Aestuariivirga sp.]|nr:hypothetical protein [Aestuariivirga sp.]
MTKIALSLLAVAALSTAALAEPGDNHDRNSRASGLSISTVESAPLFVNVGGSAFDRAQIGNGGGRNN